MCVVFLKSFRLWWRVKNRKFHNQMQGVEMKERQRSFVETKKDVHSLQVISFFTNFWAHSYKMWFPLGWSFFKLNFKLKVILVFFSLIVNLFSCFSTSNLERNCMFKFKTCPQHFFIDILPYYWNSIIFWLKINQERQIKTEALCLLDSKKTKMFAW